MWCDIYESIREVILAIDTFDVDLEFERRSTEKGLVAGHRTWRTSLDVATMAVGDDAAIDSRGCVWTTDVGTSNDVAFCPFFSASVSFSIFYAIYLLFFLFSLMVLYL